MARKILRIWEQTHRFSGEVLSVLYVYENSKKKLYDKKEDAFLIEIPSELEESSEDDRGNEVFNTETKSEYINLLKDHILLNEFLEEDLGKLKTYKRGDFLYSKREDFVFIYAGEWIRTTQKYERIYMAIEDYFGLDIKSGKIVDKPFPLEYRESEVVLASPSQCRAFKEALGERGLILKDKRILPKGKKLLFKSGHWICEKGWKLKNPGLLINNVFEGGDNKVTIAFGINSETEEIMTNVEDWLPKESIRSPWFWERWYLNYKYWKYERAKKSKGD